MALTRLKSFNQFVGNSVLSEGLDFHIANQLCISESIFRPTSNSHISLLNEARQLFESGELVVSGMDKILFETTDIGLFGTYQGREVPLDLPIDVEINEATKGGKKVTLNKPMRGGTKKYHVYVKNPETGKVIKINFGDVHGGLTAKVSNPKARKSFAARHNCAEKKDKTKAGYWACRINRYAHLWGGKTYPGFW
jgi:hypothetical protein